MFSLIVDVTSIFISLFLTPYPSQTEILDKFVEIYFRPVRFPSISAKINERECKKKKHRKLCAKGNDVVTNVICTNQHLASTFSTNSRDVPVVASPPSFSRPAARAPRRAYSQAYPGLQLRVQFLHHSIRVVCRYGRAAV